MISGGLRWRRQRRGRAEKVTQVGNGAGSKGFLMNAAGASSNTVATFENRDEKHAGTTRLKVESST